jgi:uncharacterized protein (TIGR03546 family)
MYTIYRILRNLIRSITQAAEPWQIAMGTFLGTLLGFLPIWPPSQGPSPLAFLILIVAILVNCHLGSVLVFFGVGKVLAAALSGPAVVIGDNFANLAQRCADIPFLYLSHWSHTGYLGKTLLGLCCAPLFAVLMLWTTHIVRTKLMAKLLERKKLVTAGKVANKAWLVKTACWFFGL